MPTRLEKLTALQAPRPQVVQWPPRNWTPSPRVPPAGPSAASRLPLRRSLHPARPVSMPQRLHNPSGALAILFSISDDSCNKGLADLKIAAGSVCSTDAPVTAPEAAGPPTAPAPEVSRRAAIEMPTRLEKLTALQAPRPQVVQWPPRNWTPSPRVPPAGPSAASRLPLRRSLVRGPAVW